MRGRRKATTSGETVRAKQRASADPYTSYARLRPTGVHKRNRKQKGVDKAVDGRTSLGKVLNAFRRELIAMVGGNPDARQFVMIETAVDLRRQCLLLAEKSVENKDSNFDHSYYLATINKLQLSLIRLNPSRPNFARLIKHSKKEAA